MKKIIYTDKAPAPIGPYSQGVVNGNILYTSGQIGFDVAKNDLVLDTIENETRTVLNNVKAIVTAAGFTLEDVVKATIFISNMDDFARINAVYADFFNEATAPARECVQVAKLPRNVNVEISVFAIKN
ncbi:Rid family detoxifying hydrolase [Flavobacterium agricola]|uniref:Rid family detoxifying hydrolase n=1 Tax=Flavobacterium agricola TaxID=2870839 RepID=A0ABY6M3Z9_9FLAO|nr:Rid family detoxifying hydrolase [Flavobacterium agricola]UYW02233.1 Rid family detoxifying hydrolase [Flavobacterium agricola]